MSYRDLSDEELIELIMENLVDNGRVNTDFIEIECMNGRPVISGRVSSDDQIQMIDEVLNDILDIHIYENTVWVDDSLAFENADDEEAVATERGNEDEEIQADEPFNEDDDESDDES